VNVDSFVSVLLAVIGGLLMIVWGMLTYEIRLLRKAVHRTRNGLHAVNIIVSILAKKQGLDWANPSLEDKD
jgi:hypothetical protein